MVLAGHARRIMPKSVAWPVRACVASVLIFTSIAFVHAASSRQPYTFVKIADNSDALASMTNPALNNSGTVVFLAYPRGGGSAILMGDGGDLTTVADNASFPDFNAPSLNESGIVAFSVREANSGRGLAIYAGRPGNLVRLADLADGPYADLNSLVKINNRGYAVFWGQLAAGGERIAGRSVTGGSIETIVQTNAVFGGFDQAPSVNNSGTVAFTATLQSGIRGVFTIRRNTLTTIVDSSGAFHVFSGAVNINERGSVAFHALLVAGPGGIFTGTQKSVLQPVVDDTTTFTSLRTGIGFSNDAAVVFQASPIGAGSGLFTGPDPENDAVVRAGDVIDSRVVTGVQFFQGLNDHGQVAFVAFFQDGYSAVYRADPQP